MIVEFAMNDIKDIKNLKKIFSNILKNLEEMRIKFYPKGLQLEYDKIIEGR